MERYAADRLKKLEEVCRERGLPLTTQRRTVLEVLLARTDHPTADQIFDAVQEQNPQVSRRTVYRVLETLAEWGLIRRVHHPGATARFDAKVHRHHHLVCIRCSRMVDLESQDLDGISMPKGRPHGFDVCDFSVQLMGICPECRRAQAK
jgi:Fur family peroxide stress response transcriptional regulator